MPVQVPVALLLPAAHIIEPGRHVGDCGLMSWLRLFTVILAPFTTVVPELGATSITNAQRAPLGREDRVRNRHRDVPPRPAWREFPTIVSTGINPVRTLRAATSVAADLIAMPAHPFANIAVTGRVDFVMAAGQLRRTLDTARPGVSQWHTPSGAQCIGRHRRRLGLLGTAENGALSLSHRPKLPSAAQPAVAVQAEGALRRERAAATINSMHVCHALTVESSVR